jgi:alkylation response protein AidB-like acyl-CoA dehydrogenase
VGDRAHAEGQGAEQREAVQRSILERAAEHVRPASFGNEGVAHDVVRAARALVRETVEECWTAAADGELTGEHKRRLRLAATHATWASAEAVDLMYHAGGGSSIHEASPLQRVFRDVHVATQHGMVAERTYEPLGRMALGLPTDTSTL